MNSIKQVDINYTFNVPYNFMSYNENRSVSMYFAQELYRKINAYFLDTEGNSRVKYSYSQMLETFNKLDNELPDIPWKETGETL